MRLFAFPAGFKSRNFCDSISIAAFDCEPRLSASIASDSRPPLGHDQEVGNNQSISKPGWILPSNKPSHELIAAFPPLALCSSSKKNRKRGTTGSRTKYKCKSSKSVSSKYVDARATPIVRCNRFWVSLLCSISLFGRSVRSRVFIRWSTSSLFTINCGPNADKPVTSRAVEVLFQKTSSVQSDRNRHNGRSSLAVHIYPGFMSKVHLISGFVFSFERNNDNFPEKARNSQTWKWTQQPKRALICF